MRPQARMKLGYYPLPDPEANRIANWLHYSDCASALDPCAGTGSALAKIACSPDVRRYAIELDAHRAAQARSNADEVVHGSAFDCHTPVESFSLLYLNPPYDFEVSEGKNARMETIFLEHFYRWLKPGGVLVMVVPFDRVYACRRVLTRHFRDKTIHRLSSPECELYKQIALFGVRRTQQERDRLTDFMVEQADFKLAALTRQYDAIPVLGDHLDRTYAIPPSPPARLEYRGLPLDAIEDMVLKSSASLQAQRVTHARTSEITGRPLTPLHKGHVGLCAVSGLLNGIFGRDDERHLAHWDAVKVSDRTEEENDDGATVIREKERFSQRLTLLYADGRFALLSEAPREEARQDGERTPPDGQAEVCTPVQGPHNKCEPASRPSGC